MDLEEIAQLLDADPDYRVLRRLSTRTAFANLPERPLLRGVVVDTETTGLDPTVCTIIEIGLIVFDYDPLTGQPIRIVETYGALEDPSHPLSTETTAITGITDAMVTGQYIDDVKVIELVRDATIVIAHNAAFDRPFLENRLPVFQSLPWACSLVDIDWAAEKVAARTLEYLAYQMGFFFSAHRAEEDCRALLEILANPLPHSGHIGLRRLLEQRGMRSYVVYAVAAPFATKEELKARQYRWNTTEKVWHRTVIGQTAFEEECAWLRQVVYAGRDQTIGVEHHTALTRFSMRTVPRQRVPL